VPLFRLSSYKTLQYTVSAIADDTSAVKTSVCISRSNTCVRVRTTLYQRFLLSEPKIRCSVWLQSYCRFWALNIDNTPTIDTICGYVSYLYCVSHYLYLENYRSEKKVYHPQLPVQYCHKSCVVAVSRLHLSANVRTVISTRIIG